MLVDQLLREARRSAGLTQRELAERAGTSQPAVARYERGTAVPTLTTLERLLLACGLRPEIATVRVGRTTRTEPARLRGRQRRQLLDAARRHGARDVRVFGSAARGDRRPQSDVDLLVELGPGRTLLDLASFRRDAAQILGVPVDVATPDMLKERIRADVLAEAVPL